MLIIFEAHATTLDNEAGLASGWNDVALSKKGEQQAKELGVRYRLEDLDAVFCADLQRSYKTAQLAFPGISSKKLFVDWRLRECDYGDMTLSPKGALDQDKVKRISEPFPNGESYSQTLERMKSFIDDLRGKGYKKVLIIGSRATHYGLDRYINGKSLEELLSTEFARQPGWHYDLIQDSRPAKIPAVCSAVIKKDGKYLLVQEKQAHVYGKWNFPGGHVDAGESLERAALREGSEETGYTLEIIKQLLVYHTDMDKPVLHAYAMNITGGKLSFPETELLDVRWFSPKEIIAMKPNLRSLDYILKTIAEAEKI